VQRPEAAVLAHRRKSQPPHRRAAGSGTRRSLARHGGRASPDAVSTDAGGTRTFRRVPRGARTGRPRRAAQGGQTPRARARSPARLPARLISSGDVHCLLTGGQEFRRNLGCRGIRGALASSQRRTSFTTTQISPVLLSSCEETSVLSPFYARPSSRSFFRC